MKTTPKSLRLQIGIFGRTNVGKSSFLNMLAGQDVSITSPVPGTTTDVVEKVMEFLPIGPVVFLDTGGLDDQSLLGEQRIRRTRKVFDRADVVALLVEPQIWTEFEDDVCRQAKQRQQPLIIVVNKIDEQPMIENFLCRLREITSSVMACSSIALDKREAQVRQFKGLLLASCPEDFLNPLTLVGDLLKPGGVAVMVVPIDLEAPRGRLILPQVQAIRDALDNDAAALVVKEREYRAMLDNLRTPPDIVICDSQVVLKMVADTPANIPCTTFSILMARFKGDLTEMARGVAVIKQLKPGDKVLVSEACSHHALEDDIGRVKIPRWLRQYVGMDVPIDVCSGRDYPENLSEYKLIIHCGSCMLTRRETLCRLAQARAAGVAITNYGVCISFLQGVLERVLAPFPAALDAYKQELKNPRKEKDHVH